MIRGTAATEGGGWRGLVDRYWRRRFGWLFGSLLITVGVYPLIRTMGVVSVPIWLVLAANFLVTVASMAREQTFRVKAGLGAGLVVAGAVQAVVGSLSWLTLTEALWVAASLLGTVASVRRALQPGPTDGERIFAALDAYLLAGLLFGVWYWMLEQAWPGSFHLASGTALDLSSAVYYSFVTIATLGYGDIVPASNPARGLAILEAIGGQMYVAVLIARLVTLYAARKD
jgi:hypothetical protein